MKEKSKKLMSMPLLAGLSYALIWLAIGALLLSLSLQFTNLKESNLDVFSYLIHGFAALVGGLSAGKRTEAKGWYQGTTLGIIYGLIIILVSFLASNISPSLHSFFLLLSVITIGAIGGMVGVNLRRT